MEEEQRPPLEDLRHIKKMMERSGRFISLSGLSGVSAGIFALIGAWWAHRELYAYFYEKEQVGGLCQMDGVNLLTRLLLVAVLTFAGAAFSAFLFTYLRTRKNKMPLWGVATWRLFWNTIIPLAVGAFFILKLMETGTFGLIAPACLLFYGLALVNASRYTLGEIRYLGYGQLLLGIVSLHEIGYGLYFWAAGFGVLHILYGSIMWWKYERNTENQ